VDDSELAEELRLTVGHLVRAVRAADTMPAGEAAVLGYLDRDGPQTTADVAGQRGVSHQSAAKSVKELLAQGLLWTEPHPSDGRKALLHLTSAGQLRLQQERQRRADWLGSAIAAVLTPEERDTLETCVPLLARLSVHLESRQSRPEDRRGGA
jgi:DNA-binding MarR family transcriptional regulator